MLTDLYGGIRNSFFPPAVLPRRFLMPESGMCSIREVSVVSLGRCEKEACKALLVLYDQSDYSDMHCPTCNEALSMLAFGFAVDGATVGKKRQWIDAAGDWTSEQPSFDFVLAGLRVFIRSAPAQPPALSLRSPESYSVPQPAYATA